MPEETATMTPEPELGSFADAANQASAALDKDMGRETKPAPAAAKEPTKEKPEAHPEEAKKETPAPEAKTPETPPAKKVSDLMGKREQKPAAKPEEGKTEEIKWDTAPAKMRKAFEHQSSELTQAKAQLAAYNSEIAKLKEAKAATSNPDDKKAIQTYIDEIKALKAQMAEGDYAKSDEFKEKYGTRYSKTYAKAVQQLTQLRVPTGDETNPFRTPSKDDFDVLRALPFGEQQEAAERLFGKYAHIALQHVGALDSIREEANEAISNYKSTWEKQQAEKRAMSEREEQEYARLVESDRSEIYEAWPEIFKPAEGDTEMSEALKVGREFAETFFGDQSKLSSRERAMYRSVAHARIEAFPVLERANQKLSEKVKALEEELSGLRGSDPGSGGGKAPETKPKDDDEDLSFAKVKNIFNQANMRE